VTADRESQDGRPRKALYLSSVALIIAQSHDLNACGTRGKRMPDFPRTILPFNQRIKKLGYIL
jgi:hypothetical protein